jgi:hypothetical protein
MYLSYVDFDSPALALAHSDSSSGQQLVIHLPVLLKKSPGANTNSLRRRTGVSRSAQVHFLYIPYLPSTSPKFQTSPIRSMIKFVSDFSVRFLALLQPLASHIDPKVDQCLSLGSISQIANCLDPFTVGHSHPPL